MKSVFDWSQITQLMEHRDCPFCYMTYTQNDDASNGQTLLALVLIGYGCVLV